MTTNNELFTNPPLTFSIPNDGVTNIDRPTDEKQWAVLRYELERFVCEGEYEQGLTRILDSYVAHRSRETQPSVWVSGFYGSGKSHLIRVLQHLWANTTFPDGATARGCVKVSADITAQLKELDTLGKQDGAPAWAAAGALDRNADSLNAVFLDIVLRAAGLPGHANPARVALWLHEQGVLEDVRAHVEASDGDFLKELGGYHLSRRLADAIIAAMPGFASDGAQVRDQLSNQFPPDDESVSTAETMRLFGDVMRYVGGGSIPPTLVVLDEVQEYIHAAEGREGEVRSLAEALQRDFDRKVLLVATGQQEMTASPALQKIKDRFTVLVTLQNKEVEAVVRRVLLAKEPSRVAELQSALEGASGAISRQLSGTKIQHSPKDDTDLAADYPLLPSRRRFWEAVLRQADADRSGQLRTQLRIVHDANRHIADRPIGTVIGADYLYDAKNVDLNATKQLLKETQRLIHEERGRDELRGRILGLLSLIDLLPTSGVADIGVRGTAQHLADLLIEDLSADGTTMRQRVPQVLSELVDEGTLQQDGDEYRLQTEAGRAWEQAFQRRHVLLGQSDSTIAAERDRRLREALESRRPERITQGVSRQARKIAIYDDEPPADTDGIAVWLLSAWDQALTEKQFDDVAKSRSVDDATVLAYLPRMQAASLVEALTNQLAAQQVLNDMGKAHDEENEQARRSMQSRQDRAQAEVNDLVDQILGAVLVRLSGGSQPAGADLQARIEAAAQSAVTRKYPRFVDADSSTWPKVIERVKVGSGSDALKLVNHPGNVLDHPVTKRVFEAISAAGTAASDIEKSLAAPPFGWPLDAIKAAIGVLMDIGMVTATLNGSDADAKQVMAQSRLGKVSLRRQVATLSVTEKLEAKSILTRFAADVADDDLPGSVARALSTLRARAADSSGPPPMPQISPPQELTTIGESSGNDRVKALIEAKAVVAAFADMLARYEAVKGERRAAYENAKVLAVAAEGLEDARAAMERLADLSTSRELLAETDPIRPIEQELASALRTAINASAASLESARLSGLAALSDDAAWARLDEHQGEDILRQCRLEPQTVPALGTASAVAAALSSRSLAAWIAERDAVPTRVSQALDAAVRLTAPKAATVRPPMATLASTAEIDGYIGKLKQSLVDALAESGTVVVKP